MSLRAERSEAWQSQSLRLLHLVRNDELSYIYLDPPTYSIL
ncbi:hypothetical protein [uncultured Nostoc sp.]